MLLALWLAVPAPVLAAPPSSAPSYPWHDTLRGEGEGLDAEAFADRVVSSAPSLEVAQASADEALQAADSIRNAFVPRLDVRLRFTRMFQPDNGPLASGPSDADAMNTAALLQQVSDPAAQALIGGLYDQFAALGNSRFAAVRNQMSLRLEVAYPLSDVFATIRPAVRQAEAGAQAQQAMVDAEAAQVRLRAYEAYYGHARSRALLAVAESGARRAHAQLALVEASHGLGAATQSDVLRAKAWVAQADNGTLAAQRGVDTGQSVLKTLAHQEQPIAVDEDLGARVGPLEIELDALVTRAHRERPEMVAADAMVKAQRLEMKRRRGEMMPKLALVAGMDTARPNTRLVPLADQFDTTGDASVVLSWSPNDAWSAHRNKKVSDARLRKATWNKRSLEDGIRVEVSTAYFEYRQAWSSRGNARAAVDAAQEVYRAQLERWKRGAVRHTELVDADAEVTRAQTDLVDASIAVRLARARLRRAVGRLDPGDFSGAPAPLRRSPEAPVGEKRAAPSASSPADSSDR
jgi:outer membrane protein TolC